MKTRRKKSRWPYFLIPLVTVLVSVVGSWLTMSGMNGWYESLTLPSIAPPGFVIGAVWTVIFILSTISALLVWKNHRSIPWLKAIWTVFILNAALNVFWSFLFFNQGFVGLAVWGAGALGLSVIALIILVWPISKTASILLIPYAGWVTFATYLNYLIWKLN